jgi:hypothetical protein
MRIEEIKSVQTTLKIKESMTSEKEIDDLIEYLANKERLEKISQREKNAKKQIQQSSNNNESMITNFIETRASTLERGMGCESFNKCSGKGSCQNGACMCDEGYDYFDCSVNVLSKFKIK